MSSLHANNLRLEDGKRGAHADLSKLSIRLRRLGRCGLAALEKLARAKPLVFSGVVVTLLFALVILLILPAYQTNDDALMSMFAAGQAVALEPDEHLVFTNVIIGKLLKLLYTHFPQMLWYGWYLVATQWISTIGLLYCFMRPRYRRLRMAGFVVYFFTLGLYFLVNLQFTSTSTLAGITGALILLLLLRVQTLTNKEQIRLAVSALFLLVWGGLIRRETFPLSLILASPSFLAAYWFSPAKRRIAVLVCSVVVLATGCFVLAEKYDEACYSEPAWQAYSQYNPPRAKFNDEKWGAYKPETKHIFDQVGWSINDHQMIMSWYNDDPIYDLQNLNQILNSHPWMQDRKLGQSWSITLHNIFRNRTVQAICFCLPGILLLFDRSQRWLWISAIAALTALGILLLIAALRRMPPERVFMPALAFPWLVLLNSIGLQQIGKRKLTLSRCLRAVKSSWLFQNWLWSKPGWSKQLGLRMVSLMMLIGLGANVIKLYSKGQHNKDNLGHYEKILADLRAVSSEPRLVLTFPEDFPYEYHPALFQASNYQGLHLFCFSWPQRTPIAEQMKAKFHITNIGQALAEKRDDLLLLCDSTRAYLLKYLAEHYQQILRLVDINNSPHCSISKIDSLPVPKQPNNGSASLQTKPYSEPNKSR
jgi:hypothetical protein